MKKILCIIGAVLVFCSIGAEQIGEIGFGQALIQCMFGMPLLAIGVM